MVMRRMGCFRRPACIGGEVDVAVMEVAGWRVHTYLHGDEGDDGRRKDRDHSQTGQQATSFIDGRHLGRLPRDAH